MIPLPLKARRFVLAAFFPEEFADEEARIRGTPQKGLRNLGATIDACRWPDFYSGLFMIATVETG
jgi:hypothetical protein